MQKNTSKLLILIIIACITAFAVTGAIIYFAFAGGKDTQEGDNKIPVIDKVALSSPGEADLTVSGRVRDVYFEGYEGVEVYIELDGTLKKAAVTDSDGRYTFYVKNIKLDRNFHYFMRLTDFLSLDGTVYNFNAVEANVNIHTPVREIDIVCAPKDSSVNVFNLIEIGHKVAFHQDGLPLPEGYMSREYLVTETVNGETVLRGVEFYVGDHLVGVGNQYGFNLRNLYPGSVVTLKKEGFYFLTLASGVAVPLVVPATDSTPEYADSFIVPSNADPFPYQIRAALKEGISIQDLDL